ncbi:uncharacterized protein [Cherax quadricarinatus]|uniref:uncharacterized protein n=1 Tax=Cherax quadricarinatus TaxID=27406 RepID=UPI0023797B85|nr:uncharacterized protein LOC128687999 [Cherax quadricarinatus]
MVKMQAVQSALAIRRQRSRREDQRRAKQRRESRASLSTPRPSVVSLDGRVYFNEEKENKRLLGQVTMFHVGSVFIVIGLMLTITSLVPGYVKSTTPERRSDLLGTGCFFVFLGGVLTTISRFVSNNEEKELNKYIKGRLSRTKSGHRLVRDAESGLPTPTRERRQKPQQNGIMPASPAKAASSGSKSAKLEAKEEPVSTSPNEDGEAACSSPGTQDSAMQDTGPMTSSASMEPVLSRILEEDENDADTATTEPIDSTPESSLTPTSPLETQGLLERHHSSPRKGSKSSSKSSTKSSRHSGV